MPAVTAALVKELREMTGAGMMDCKKALTATDGDIEKAVEFLREKGLAAAAKKAGRIAAEGLVTAKVVGSKAVIVEVNSETDFVAKNAIFQKYVSDVADQIMASANGTLEGFLAEPWAGDPTLTVEQELSEQISVIGDGALTGGLAFEALDNVSSVKGNFIIVLNDNTMSISENVGGVSNFLGKLRTSKIYTGIKESITGNLRRIPSGDDIHDVISNAKDSIKQLVVREGMMFEDMGITYLGPFDGHNINQLVKAFRTAKQAKGPVLLHILTKKGKGYPFAEANPGKFHGIDPFDPNTGKLLRQENPATYTKLFSDCMMQLGKQNEKVVAITAAMADGTGLSRFSRHFPDRFFDVGIAEAHAVTFAAGLAVSGMKPYVAIYSSFLQRAYDSILHDVCMQKLPVTFAVDRAGIVGKDGETHQGVFDLSYLTSMPNLTVMAPKNAYEFAQMFLFSSTFEGPLAIRYPRGEALLSYKSSNSKIIYGKAEVMKKASDSTIALVAIGSMVKTAMETAERLAEEGIEATVVNLRFAKPLDLECICSLKNYKNIFTLEENVKAGGIGEQIAAYLMEQRSRAKVRIFAVPDRFIPHGCVDVLMCELGLDTDHIYEEALKAVKGSKADHE